MPFWSIVIVGAMLFVAYTNGANDNFKGVATLFGSGTTDYRRALWWATATTLAGSIAAFFLATELISTFQGKSLVPPSLTQSEPFFAAVILGAAATVFMATKMGIPISTTHSLTGALVGSGIVAVGFNLGFDTLLQSFFLPLLLSPIVAVVLAFLGYPVWNAGLRAAGVAKESCICIGSEIAVANATPQGAVVAETHSSLSILVDSVSACAQPLPGVFFGVKIQSLLNVGHFLSAGAVSFARGLNDTPKIVALGLIGTALDLSWSIVLVALVMALGGLVGAKKVAETVSKRITALESDQGLVANLATGFLVIFASKWGMPVSTTHVSCGSLFGIGIVNGRAQWSVIRTILVAWVLTLPMAGASAGLIYAVLSRLAAE